MPCGPRWLLSEAPVITERQVWRASCRFRGLPVSAMPMARPRYPPALFFVPRALFLREALRDTGSYACRRNRHSPWRNYRSPLSKRKRRGLFWSSIRDRSAVADAAIDRLSLRQQELENVRSSNQVVVDVSNQAIGIQQARVRYLSAVKNRVLEEQLLSAEQKKFALGASTTYNVVQQERDLAAAQSTEMASLVAYSQAQVSLDQTLGTTLLSNHVSIEEATVGKVTRVSTLPDTLPK